MPASKNLSYSEIKVYSQIKKLNERARVIYKEYGANSQEYLKYKKSIESSFSPDLVKVSRSGAISVKQSEAAIKHIMSTTSEGVGLSRSLQLKQKRDYKNMIKRIIREEEGIKNPTKAKVKEYEEMINRVKKYVSEHDFVYADTKKLSGSELYDYNRYEELLFHKGRRPTYEELNEAVDLLEKHKEEWEKNKYSSALQSALDRYTIY